MCGAGLDPFTIDVASEGVGRGDRHDGRGHECTDGDGREGDSGEPGWEEILEQLRNDELRVGHAIQTDRLRAGSDRHPSEQRQQAEHETVGGKDCCVAADRVAAP